MPWRVGEKEQHDPDLQKRPENLSWREPGRETGRGLQNTGGGGFRRKLKFETEYCGTEKQASGLVFPFRENRKQPDFAVQIPGMEGGIYIRKQAPVLLDFTGFQSD